MVQTRVLASDGTVLLEALANVRPALGIHRVRPGVVYSTREGPFVQYCPPADTDEAVEVDIPVATPAQIEVARQMAAGQHGDVFRIEAPRETIERAALLPGREGVAVELWPSPVGAAVARVVLRFVRV